MPKNNITTGPLTAFSAAAARISVAAGAGFVVLFAALHVLAPETDPAWRFISEYQLGRHGWLMSVAFLSLMVSSASLFLAIQSQVRTIGGYIGLFFLGVSAIGFGLAGFFVTDSIVDTTATAHGALHSTGALLGGNISGAAYFLGWSLARNKAWVSARRSLLWITCPAIVGNVAAVWMQAMIAQAQFKFGPDVRIGWPNRVLIVAYSVWMIALAWRLLRLYRSGS